ncbi:MAG: ATP-binding protein [bacterium]|nr:ATP-binding protein [bacterium]
MNKIPGSPSKVLLTLLIFFLAVVRTHAASCCLSFGPECDAYVTVPYSPDFDLPGPFTIECWFTVHGPHENDQPKLLSTLTAFHDNTDGGWAIGLNEPFSEQLPTRIIGNGCPAPFSPILDRWYHLALTCDGKYHRLFLDGKLVNEIPEEAHVVSVHQPLTIGGQNGSYMNRNLNGMIDEVRISRCCRYTDNFIPKDFFDNNRQTIALWHFDEGKGDKIYDESAGQHHGTIHKAKWVKLSDGESNSYKHIPSPVKTQRNYFLAAAILLLLTSAGLSILYWKKTLLQIQPASDDNHSKQTASWVFLAQRMTHQIKTPLSTILMCLERIQQEYQSKLPPEAEKRADNYVDGAIREIKRLIDSSRAFLQFLKIEAPTFSLTSLSEFLDRFLQSYKIRLPEEITLTTDFQPDLSVKMDPTLMQVVLENLFDNAIKAMDGKGILGLTTFGAEELSTENQQVIYQAIIEVEDSGKGMSPEMIEKVFQPYVSKSPEGTGLGLFVVRRIIEDHHGQIHIKSREGIGTKITIILPAVKQEEESHG